MDQGNVIASCPHIVKHIFFQLSGRDLSSCAQVCSLWNGIAVTEKKRRKYIHWLFQRAACPQDGCLNDLHDFVHVRENSQMEASFQAHMRSMKIQPVLCIAFISKCLFENFSSFFPSSHKWIQRKKKLKLSKDVKRRSRLKTIIDQTFKPFLSEGSTVVFAVAPGIIGLKEDFRPVEVEEGSALAGLFLPSIPGVQVHRFPIENKDSDFAAFIADKEPVKCLLLFATNRGMITSYKSIKEYVKNPEGGGTPRMAVGGAIVENTESLLGSAVVFSGPNVEAASVIITHRDHQPEVEAKLRLFQQTGLLENRCFAFMFACLGRGHYHYEEFHVESSIFSKLYPRVPLVGLFGNGEIGVNFLPNIPLDDSSLKTIKSLKKKEIVFSYTTVFVLVSIKV